MRSSSPTFQRLSSQIRAESSNDGDEDEDGMPLHPPLRPAADGDDDGDAVRLLSGSGSEWQQQNGSEFVDDDDDLAQLPAEQTLPPDDLSKDAINGTSLARVVTEEERSSRFDLTWTVSWLLMLSRELNCTFVFGVMAVYGFGQGIGGAINDVVVDYYWKDVQLALPSAVQMYRGFSAIPWDVKPIWGLMTDILPVAGYHRRPYFLITGVMMVFGTMALVMGGQLWVPLAVAMLVLLSACAALSDATIDAEIAKKSQEKPQLAPDIQSLCTTCIAVGSLVGYGFSGLAIDTLGPKGALSLMVIPASLLLVLGFVLHEERDPVQWQHSQIAKQVWTVFEQMWMTLKQTSVWKPTLYMYLSLAVNADISEGKFYWYTTANNGPRFSEEFVGAIYATGSVGTLGAVYLYHKKLKRVSFRWILFWVQALIAIFGVLDLCLVTRLNRKFHIPDKIFVVGDEGVTQALSRLKWMPLLILAAKLCPPGIYGTFFAFLMSVDNVGTLTSTWLGAALLRITRVTRENYKYLWLAVVIRNTLRLIPLFLVFLLPNTDPEEEMSVLTQPEENVQLVVTSIAQKENSFGNQTLG